MLHSRDSCCSFSICFNGAATITPRNGVRSAACTATVASFNGAATITPRNAPLNRGNDNALVRFNGAATITPRNAAPLVISRSTRNPLQRSRDNHAAECFITPTRASALIGLQRSRDNHAAECGGVLLERPEEIRLQRSRDNHAAECRRGSNGCVSGEVASTEPRQSRRGMRTSQGFSPNEPLLQRSRDNHAAECCSIPMRSTRATSFNGAATITPRNVPTTGALTLFDGARFNGAATIKPRNAKGRDGLANRILSASTEPRQSRRGMCTERVYGAYDGPASTEPRQSRRGM